MKKFIFLLLITGFSLKKTKYDTTDMCEYTTQNYIHYYSSINTLAVCADGSVIEKFRASHGSSGMGKTQQGDRKTPVGEYNLSRPRPSNSFWRTFIHIGYPRQDQINKGYTGANVGLHGPLEYFPYRNDFINYGAGCIVTENNESIDKIENHIRQMDINLIYIE